MARIKKENWFEQQDNQRIRSFTWYLFVNPENLKSLSSKIFPRKALTEYCKNREIKGFGDDRISQFMGIKEKTKRKAKNTAPKTPKNYFIIFPRNPNIKYDKDKVLLNLNFLFDYLASKDEKNKPKKLILSDEVKYVIEDFFNKQEIRELLFNWNKYEDDKLTYDAPSKLIEKNIELFKIGNKIIVQGKTIPSYIFERSLHDAIISFFRYIYRHTFTDIDLECIHHYMLSRVFDKETGKEYFKLRFLIDDFILKINLLQDKFKEIDEAFKYVPIKERTTSVWQEKNFVPADEIEKQIVSMLDPGPKKEKLNLSISDIKDFEKYWCTPKKK